MSNGFYNVTSHITLASGATEEKAIEYYCFEGYYFSDENVNAKYTCNLGAKWNPKKPPTCIKGCRDFAFRSVAFCMLKKYTIINI